MIHIRDFIPLVIESAIALIVNLWYKPALRHLCNG